MEGYREIAEALSSLGGSATAGFIVWVVFDFLKECLPYIFWISVGLIIKNPVKNFVVNLAEQCHEEEKESKK